MTEQQFWGGLYPLFEDGTIARLVETGKRRERVSRMKQNHLALLEKNRLLKRKIRNFNG
jgi:hypothetical protein